MSNLAVWPSYGEVVAFSGRNGWPIPVFKARVQLVCCKCSHPIRVGSEFTRVLGPDGLTLQPACRPCAPWKE